MKKLLTATVLATTIGTANAIPAINHISTPRPTYSSGYHTGYRHGREDAINDVAKTAVEVGTAVIAGIIIYQLAKESNWTATEKGVTYRF